ncbi:AEC family transporter [Actinomycetospora lutea]|uniref:AEC family transporter n=1 Tax=Actinomycetospora lutea TaxID=663604 RepID=UPI002366E86E|nr:AEC family transporter [Actinomycetospora lutea]MDD7941472.1 AEC family transporter [Actinomycetospora lutea]
MGELLSRILPVFAVIAVGAVAGRFERFGERTAAVLNDLVYWVALPALIFVSVAGADLSAGVPASALLASAAVVVVAYALGWAAARVVRRPPREAHAVGLVASWGNVGYLGIPLTVAVLGPATAFAASLTSTLHTALAISVFLVAVTLDGRGRGEEGAVALPALLARRVLGNPVVVGIVAGVAVALLGVRLPPPVATTIGLLGDLAAPGGLFALGILLRGAVGSLRGSRAPWGPIGAAVAIKLLVMPALALGAAVLFGVPAPWGAVLVVMAALPDAATVFVLTAQYRAWYRESTAVVVITTVLSLVTLPLVVLVLP